MVGDNSMLSPNIPNKSQSRNIRDSCPDYIQFNLTLLDKSDFKIQLCASNSVLGCNLAMCVGLKHMTTLLANFMHGGSLLRHID